MTTELLPKKEVVVLLHGERELDALISTLEDPQLETVDKALYKLGIE